MTVSQVRSLRAIMCILVLWFSSCTRPCFAQNISKQPLPAFFRRSYSAKYTNVSLPFIVEQISRNYKISIFVDAEPVRAEASFDFHGSVADALDEVADSFDYRWKTTKSGAVLFMKRFKDPQEYPQINLAEMLQMSQDILSALRIVEINSDREHRTHVEQSFVASFSDAQVGLLKSGQRIEGSQLPLAQSDLLRNLLIAETFSPGLEPWEECTAMLSSLDRATILVRKQTTDENTEDDLLLFMMRDLHGQFRTITLENAREIKGGKR